MSQPAGHPPQRTYWMQYAFTKENGFILFSMATLLDLVGNTPLIELNRLLAASAAPFPADTILYGKLEGNNAGGSVKDRAPVSMIQGALKRGELRPGMTSVEATSGKPALRWP